MSGLARMIPMPRAGQIRAHSARPSQGRPLAERWAGPTLSALLVVSACNGKKGGSDARPAASATTLQEALQRAREAAHKTPRQSPAAAASSEPLGPEARACAELCAHTAKLSCGNTAACEAFCREYATPAPCGTALSKYVACAVRAPPESWECDQAMTPALKSGLCATEQAAFSSCVTTGHATAP